MRRFGSIISKAAIILLAICMLIPQVSMPVYAEDVIEVSDAAGFNAVIADLNANGGSKTIKLTADVALTQQNPQIKKGELTILGEGHTLTVSISVLQDGKLNLGKDGYDKTLDMPPGKSDLCVVNTDGNGQLNIYDGVTIRDCTRAGQAGGITSFGNSVINMYGGTITNCASHAVAGGIYLDQHSVFNMYGGTISNCTGLIGGAVGLSGGSPIGPSTAGPVSFNMYDGTIENCSSTYYGGGAVCCAYSSYPVTFNMKGGTIKNCEAKNGGTYNYGGGAVYILSLSDFTFHMDGGTITGCDSTNSRYGYGGAVMIYTSGSGSDIKFTKGTITKNSGNYGGGIFLWKGSATIADGFSLHNNTATGAGDDIYNNAQAVNLGTVDTSATLESCGHPITGWYEDAEKRWNYTGCGSGEEHIELFEHTGVVYSEEYGLKAAHGELLYTVVWKNDDGTVLEIDENVPYGETPSYDGPTPTKPSDGQYKYTFAGWEPSIVDVTKDAEYKATFDATPIEKKVEITYDLNGGTYNGSGDDIVEEYEAGESITIHAAPKKDGFRFVEWSKGGYQPGDSYTVPEDGYTFVAVWEAVDDDDDDDDDGGEGGGGVKTGDDSELTLMLGLFSTSLTALLAIIFYRRRRHE